MVIQSTKPDKKSSNALGAFGKWLTHVGRGWQAFFQMIIEGDWATKLSVLIMGFGSLARRQIVKGLLFLGSEIAFIIFYARFGWQYVKDLGTLGVVEQSRVLDPATGIRMVVPGDNSMLILLYSVLTLATLLPLIMIWKANIRASYLAQKRAEQKIPQPSFVADARTLLDKRYHMTLMSFPLISLALFTALPILFMILIAFTNFDKMHQPPGHLFGWVGIQNITDIFAGNPFYQQTFFGVLLWTFIWAIFATATNYIFGMILALLINKEGINYKKMWRTFFVITIAVPQFVSLMLVSKLFAETGIVNQILLNLNLVKSPVPFFENPNLARVMAIVINMWVGVPYTMLMTTGILMNIPAELYESANVDGASPVRTFFSITLPYMLFVTGPYLITTFVGNINNFNVIYLLTAGGPLAQNYYRAGKTDLLVTWLYKLTVDEQNYSLASTIGILIFVIVSIVSLLAYNLTGSVKKEDQFS
ncbi:MAG: sugar ABC transporter permease [Oscillospiraceae bacterium]|jgi:arabinogalactan oligomer/maltooligosaccharide transport system permease protein|nr:sugar ABC transporter permease [Oscillospiraceae bacterium]